MAIDLESIGRRLRDDRERKKLTQAQVGRKIGITPQAVSLVERRKSGAIDTLESYAKSVGCPFVFSVGGDDDAPTALLARLARTLPSIDASALDTLDALVARWEGRQQPQTGSGARRNSG